MAEKLKLDVLQGETFVRIIRWGAPPFIYKPITAITRAAPAQITAVGHGLVTGWPVAVVSVLGMTEINAQHTPPRVSEYVQATRVDADNITLNTVNSSGYTAYTSGGYLQYYTPVALAGFSARMTIKNRIGGTVLASLTSGAPDNRIALDDTNHTITLTISAVDTAAFAFTSGTYDLEMVAPTGAVTRLYQGAITISKEVTT